MRVKTGAARPRGVTGPRSPPGVLDHRPVSPRLGDGHGADLLKAFTVSTAVNRAGRDAPELVEPLAT
jgi:hypothetical protein